MSLEESQYAVAESHEYNTVLYWAKATTQLVSTLEQITLIKNSKPEGMAPEVIAQRRVLIGVVLEITKKEFKTTCREFINALQKWERF